MPMRWWAGVAVGAPLVGIVGLGAWRSQLVAPFRQRRRAVVAARRWRPDCWPGGELSLRSAADWQFFFVSAGDRDATPSLRLADPWSALLLVVVLGLICPLFVSWSLAAARRWIPTDAGPPKPNATCAQPRSNRTSPDARAVTLGTLVTLALRGWRRTEVVAFAEAWADRNLDEVAKR